MSEKEVDIASILPAIYRHAYEEALDGIAFADAETGIILDCNRAFEKMTGYSKAEIIGQPQTMVHPPEDIDGNFSRTFQQNRKENSGQVVETSILTKTGETRQVEIKAVPLVLGSKKFLHATFHDLTKRKSAEDNLRRQAEEMTVLQETVLALTAPNTSLADLLHSIVERATKLLRASSGGLYLVEPEHEQVRCMVSYLTPQDYTGTVLAFGEGAAGHVAQTGESLLIDDYRTWTGRASIFEVDQPFQSVISAPLIWRGKVMGVIHALREAEKDKFTKEDLNLLMVFANHAAVAVENAHLYESIEQELIERKQAEAALKESETLYHDLVETAQDLIWQCDQKGRYIYLNPAWEEVFGYKLTEMIGKPFSDFQNPEYAQHDRKAFAELLAGNDVKGLETVHISKDGKNIHLVFNAKAVRDEEGNVIGTQGTAYDVTARKQAEETLRESEERYRTLVTNAPLVIFIIDSKGFFTLSEGKGLSRLGLKPGEVVGMSAFDVYRHYPSIVKKLKLALTGEFVRSEIRVQGTIFDVSYIPVKTSSGKVERVIGVANDITERKQAEEVIQESESRYRSIVESSPLGMHVYELQAPNRLVFVGANPAADKILGVDNSNFIDKTIEDAFPALAGTDVPKHYIEAATKGTPWQTEQIDYDSEGIRGAFEVIAFQIAPNKMVAMFQDITTRRIAEDSLQVRTRELETLFSLSSHLRSAQSANEMLPLVLKEIQKVVSIDASAITLLSPDKENFTYAIGDGVLAPNIGRQYSVENSISGIVYKTHQSYVTEDLSTDSQQATSLSGTSELGPAVIVPLLSETDFIGVIICGRKKEKSAIHFKSTDVQVLTAIGEMVANALRRARLFDQALARLQNLQALHSIDMAISANMDLAVVLNVLLTQGVSQLEVDAADILLLEPNTHMMKYAAGYGFRTKTIEKTLLRIGEGLPGQVALKQEIIYLNNIETNDMLVRRKLLDENFISYQAAPLIAKGQLQGVLETFCRSHMTTSDEQFGFLETLATQAAIAIDNAKLFIDLQRSNFEMEMAYDATIEGWSRALELRDQETEGHTLRVTDMTIQLVHIMGAGKGEIIHIRWGALLHDIGKMGIPDNILLKSGSLDANEWKTMKLHTVYAYEMLKPIEFLSKAVDIPYCHHERWDGKGYPRQLQGEQIPLSARIFAIADVWDALTNDRPYRKAWKEEKALEYIITNRGTHFDPQVVDAFVVLKESNAI